MSTSNGFTEINGIFDSVADLQKYSGKSISTVAVNNGTVLGWYQVSTIDNGSAVALDSGLFANPVAPSVAGFGTAAYADITTSSDDATADRVLTQGSVGFEYQRHIKATKGFSTGNTGTAEVFYLGTIVSGKHNIKFSTRGNFGYNTYEIDLEMVFSNVGTDGVSPHAGVKIASEIKGNGAYEFLSFSTIKVNSVTAAVYLLYQTPHTHTLQVGYNSFTADTLGVSPNATETWTPLSVATASSGSNEIPTLLYMDDTLLSYNGDEVLTDGMNIDADTLDSLNSTQFVRSDTDSTITGSFLADDPATTTDWNANWQTGFYEGSSAANAPTASGWYWGLKSGHSNNSAPVRFGMDLVISLATNLPYIRNTSNTGAGTWQQIHTSTNTNLNEFITNNIGERLLEGVGISHTEVDCPLPTSSFTYPASLTAVGGYTITDSRNGAVKATNVLPVLSPISTPKTAYARFTTTNIHIGKRYRIIASTANSKITVNF